MKVLSTIPNYGGRHICKVLGEDSKYYALEYNGVTFKRKKKKCILLFEEKNNGNNRDKER